MPWVMGPGAARVHASAARGAAYIPRAGGLGDSQLGMWPFDSSAADAAARLLRWRQAVQTRGNAAVVMPSQGGSFAGQLAERIDAAKVPAGSVYPPPAVRVAAFWYVPAPQELRDLYAKQGAANTSAIATQALVERVQSLPAAVINAAGGAARDVTSAVTGIPKWAIPVVLLAAGGYALYTVLGGVRMLAPGRQDPRD